MRRTRQKEQNGKNRRRVGRKLVGSTSSSLADRREQQRSLASDLTGASTCPSAEHADTISVNWISCKMNRERGDEKRKRDGRETHHLSMRVQLGRLVVHNDVVMLQRVLVVARLLVKRAELEVSLEEEEVVELDVVAVL
jgi:hypothetical protein